MPEFKSVDGACATTVAAAIDPSLEGKIIPDPADSIHMLIYVESSGAYLDDCKPTPPTPGASRPENAEKLWNLSEKLVGEKFSY